MPKRKGEHLTYDDRLTIEEMLKEHASLRSIARALDVSPTTISHEIKTNRDVYWRAKLFGDPKVVCLNYEKCFEKKICSLCKRQDTYCKCCEQIICYKYCSSFNPAFCQTLMRAPFVCYNCKKRAICNRPRARYVAHIAQDKRDRALSRAHIGIACSEKELKTMVETVKKLLGQGQSLESIWITHGKEFPVGVRTFYNYIEKGVMGLTNLDLPKKVRYIPRKKKATNEPKMKLDHHTYADWLALTDEERLLTVQIDCVEGRRKDKQCILSLHFPRLFFQLYVLMPDKTQASVQKALDALEVYCEGSFGEVFPILLGDRGSEFLDHSKIEIGINKNRRTRMFYCDPVKPGQKGACEKNHVELRKILPKGSNFDVLSFTDVALVCSHVNSYPRAGQLAAPIELAKLVLPQNLLDSLGICHIPSDNVIMTPSLLK